MANRGITTMEMLRYGIFLWFYIFFEYSVSINRQIREYCNDETFEARCSEQEVIIMTHALYGRMKRGKCMGSDSGLGCKSNVLQSMDEMCSNKQRCEVDVASDFKSIQTSCPVDLMRYLESDYSCEKVLQIQQSECRSSAANIEVTSKISVSSELLSKAHCGSSSMKFTARPGQQLIITITDFNHQNNPNNQRSCVNYLELTEPSGKSEPVCAGSYGRTGHVMVTSGHDVSAVFHIQDLRNQRFILTFEAVGCGDITPPEGTWVQREGDETTLGCHSGRHSWTLRCENNQWVGAVGSCGTAISVKKNINRQEVKESEVALGIAVFAFFSVLLLLCSTTFSVGVCIYTKRNGKETKSHRQLQTQTLPLFAHNRPPQTAVPVPQNQLLIEQQQFIDQNVNQNPDVQSSAGHPSRNQSNKSESDQLYCNTMQSQSDSIYSDSVKYYVLENLQEPLST